ncbi:PEP-CTERM sorting domain-containing protein [Pseudoduganella umbonata]|uniref:PEP-CTERM sorting domain-containing protein n=1 Tax=Pseudoduganella umbonata TaxID=864828 RepID=A0A4P8HPV7_9BURK|nr:PEP-CTERM sorting domain-containing protein [Pseudoduganella umbonata]MBB3221327.1 hypothetical protein [Pseudoduganella umbonata]QCP10494.1 PEP-CTERM sorting domain-containing protein [Pseudoduganella umbonata]
MSKLLAFLAAACFIAAPVHAETLAIDFNTVPGADGRLGTADDEPIFSDGYPSRIEEEYAAVGVHFNTASVAKGAFFDGNPGNTFLTSQPVSGWFDMPVYGISIDSYSYWNATLSAYDAAGNLLVSDSIDGGWQRATLSVASTAPIFRFTVLPDAEGRILNLDNLALAVSPVPEPSQLAMLAGGLLLVGSALRRRR